MQPLKSILMTSSLALGILILHAAFAQKSAEIRVYGTGGLGASDERGGKGIRK